MISTEHINESSWLGLFYDYDEIKRDKKHIKKVDMIPTDINCCKVYTDGKSVYANANFYTGDIIEICPTKEIDKTSLFSRDIRDIIFEVIPKVKYVIPFGYCQFYDIITKYNPVPNCDYLYDEISNVIVIKAITNIKKNEKLILNLVK